MALFALGPEQLIIILVIVLIIFGPSRLPQLGKSLGKTMKAIRDGADGEGPDEDDDAPKPKPAKAKAKAATSDNQDVEDEE